MKQIVLPVLASLLTVHNHKTIDMVLSLNGIPLVALELKTSTLVKQ